MRSKRILKRYMLHEDGTVTFGNKQVSRYVGKTDPYLVVSLKQENGRHKKFFVHRLVAEHFVKRKEDECRVVFKDGDKLNPSADNLEWRPRSGWSVSPEKHQPKLHKPEGVDKIATSLKW